MVIRPAKPDDAAQLSEIARAAKQYWSYSVATMERWRDELTISAAAFETDPTFVAEIADTPCGFYQLSCDANRWELEHFWVSPSQMRRGIGTKLLAHALGVVRSRGASELHIDADPNAEAFYRACGAERVGYLAAPIAEDASRVRPQMILRVR